MNNAAQVALVIVLVLGILACMACFMPWAKIYQPTVGSRGPTDAPTISRVGLTLPLGIPAFVMSLLVVIISGMLLGFLGARKGSGVKKAARIVLLSAAFTALAFGLLAVFFVQPVRIDYSYENQVSEVTWSDDELLVSGMEKGPVFFLRTFVSLSCLSVLGALAFVTIDSDGLLTGSSATATGVAARPGRRAPLGVRRCPYCRELVRRGAVYCSHCRSDLTEPLPGWITSEERLLSSSQPSRKRSSMPCSRGQASTIAAASSCPGCGAQLTACSRYCRSCGRPVPGEDSPTRPV